MSRRDASLTDVDSGGGAVIRRVGVLALTIGAGIAVGLGLGRWSAADRPEPALSVAPPAMAPPVASVRRVVADVPEGFAHDAEGARQAAAAFLGVEVSDLMADPEAYRSAWREMCTPGYYAAGGRAAAETVLANQESANHLLTNAAHGQRVFEHALPLSVWVVSEDGDTATVRTWSLVVQHPGDGPTVVLFDAGTMQLRWLGGDWKLDGGSGSSSTADGASGPLRLDDGPGLPAYLEQPEIGDVASNG